MTKQNILLLSPEIVPPLAAVEIILIALGNILIPNKKNPLHVTPQSVPAISVLMSFSVNISKDRQVPELEKIFPTSRKSSHKLVWEGGRVQSWSNSNTLVSSHLRLGLFKL